MIGAALLAKNAVEKGLERKPWVKTSLAPGSKVVSDYYERSGLTPYLDKLGFNLVGYGCTTCIGNSGPLIPEVSARRERDGPGRGQRALRQPQLRGPDQPRREDELPRVAAAGRRLRAGRLDGRSTSSTTRWGRTPTATTSSSRTSGPSPQEIERVIGEAITVEHVHRRLRRRLRRRPAVEDAADARGRHVRVGRGLDVRPQASLLRRHAATSPSRSPTSRARGCCSSSATRSPPTTSARPARSRRTAPPGSTSPSTASSSATSTPTARGAATTR